MQRLKTRAQFEAVMAGATVSRTAHFVLHRRSLDAMQPPATATPDSLASQAHPPDAAAGPTSGGPAVHLVSREAWIGALVPKRWAKRAVTRNTIKRQIYTVSQAFESHLPIAAHVVRLRAGFDRVRFVSATSPALRQEVRSELQELFARAAP